MGFSNFRLKGARILHFDRMGRDKRLNISTNPLNPRSTPVAHTLAPLPYAFNAMEPHIDAQTMEIHHGKHHQAYVTNLNKAVEGTAVESKTAEELIKDLSAVPEDKRTAVRNNAGGHVNHTFFWQIIGWNAGGKPSGALLADIEATFGSFEAFKEKLVEIAILLVIPVFPQLKKRFCWTARGQPRWIGPFPCDWIGSPWIQSVTHVFN